MLPTYSFSEIKGIIRSFDVEDIAILTDLIQEEILCYSSYESRAIFKMIMLRKKALIINEVQLGYLLAYN